MNRTGFILLVTHLSLVGCASNPPPGKFVTAADIPSTRQLVTETHRLARLYPNKMVWCGFWKLKTEIGFENAYGRRSECPLLGRLRHLCEKAEAMEARRAA